MVFDCLYKTEPTNVPGLHEMVKLIPTLGNSEQESSAVQCVTSQVKVNHDILTPDSRDNLLKVPFDIEILIYFQIKIPSSKKSLLFLCFVQSY